MKYVPLIESFQLVLIPVSLGACLVNAINPRWGLLYFVFAFPLINNLPYFFGIAEPIPHAPAALILFLFFFMGWLIRCSLRELDLSYKAPIFKPLVLFSILVVVSGFITFLRYANFFPFLSDGVYELVTNVEGVTAGGAIMSIVFFSLNYLSGFAFFFILLNTVSSREFMKKLVIVLCLSTLISLSFGGFQHFFNGRLGNNPISIDEGLINATFKDALSFGAYIGMLFPLALGLVVAFRGIARILCGLVVILSAFMVFHSGSRSGLLCLIVSLLLFGLIGLKDFIMLPRKRILSSKKIILSATIIVLLIITVVSGFIILNADVSQSRTLSRFKHLAETGVSSLLSGQRVSLWKIASRVLYDYPISGIGQGCFIVEVSNFSAIYGIPIQCSEPASHYFLNVGAEMGLAGLVLILWIFWEIVRKIVVHYPKHSNNRREKFLFIGATVAIISYFISIQFHTFIGSFEIKYTFWLLVAIVFCFNRKNQEEKKTRRFSRRDLILSIIALILVGAVHMWNSIHSLSLRSRTAQLGLKQDFGFYQYEKTEEGRDFRWTREYGGLTVSFEKPVVTIPLLASHPDITRNPVDVKIFLIRDLFRQKILLGEISLNTSSWKEFEYYAPEHVGQEFILLFKVSKTWNPAKALGTPDPRNLGVAVGEIGFRERLSGR